MIFRGFPEDRVFFSLILKSEKEYLLHKGGFKWDNLYNAVVGNSLPSHLISWKWADNIHLFLIKTPRAAIATTRRY